MPVESELNKVLKEMWRLDEKVNAGGELSDAEKDFWNQNLDVIKKYYADNDEHWKNK